MGVKRMDDLFGRVYHGKKVLITGHTGFKGSWLALWLSQMGAEVLGYSKDVPTNPSHFVLLDLNIESVIDDILNKQKLAKTIANFQPDIVFHLAAQALVRNSYLEPVKTFETNVMGTVNLLESCRDANSVKAIINITSDKCYHNTETDHAYTEDDPMGGRDPYSASKGCAELVANAYRHSFMHNDYYGKNHHVLLANARAGNVIGGGDWAKDRLIPDIVRATSKGETAVVRNPNSTRPWQHVLEPLSGYLHLGWRLLEEQKDFAENWNFGPNDQSDLAVKDVIKHTLSHWDKIRYQIIEDPTSFHEAKTLKLDSGKARHKLKWQSIWDAPKTIAKTVGWYKHYYDGDGAFSLSDLSDYIADAKLAKVEWTKV